MTRDELAALVGRQIARAVTRADQLGEERAELFDRYLGELYGDEVEGRSKVVSRDIADTVGWIMPSLMEIFTAGDDKVEFEPVGPEDEAQAKQETQVINHVFERSGGFLVLHDWMHDGLLGKNGFVKSWWEVAEETKVERYRQPDMAKLGEAIKALEAQGAKVEVEQDQEGEEQGDYVPTVRLKITRKCGKARVAAVPPEEVLVDPSATLLDLDEAAFVAHRRIMRQGELIAAGYNARQIKGLPTHSALDWNEERQNRESSAGTEDTDDEEWSGEAMRPIAVHECYIRVDYDGDGLAELRKVTVAGTGNEVLKWKKGGYDLDEVEQQPFSTWTPYRLPHRFWGVSVAEQVVDLQRIKTVLTRQLLDNIYSVNMPRVEVPEAAMGDHTIDDLTNFQPGAPVRTAGAGGLIPLVVPPMLESILPAIEYIETVRENRTGVTRYNQGMDAGSLNKTAAGINRIMTASQQKLQLIARMFAETGLKHLFRRLHGLMQRHAGQQLAIRLRGQWIQADPREWAERTDLSVNVGLGAGNKQEMLGHLMQMLLIQKEMRLDPKLAHMVTDANVHNTVSRVVENAGLKSPELFFTDPAASGGPPEQGPSPEQLAMQAEQEKAQLAHQAKMAELELKHQDMLLQDDRERDKMLIDAMFRDRELDQAAQQQREQNDLAQATAQQQAKESQFKTAPRKGTAKRRPDGSIAFEMAADMVTDQAGQGAVA
jgi:hypothetical protein